MKEESNFEIFLTLWKIEYKITGLVSNKIDIKTLI